MVCVTRRLRGAIKRPGNLHRRRMKATYSVHRCTHACARAWGCAVIVAACAECVGCLYFHTSRIILLQEFDVDIHKCRYALIAEFQSLNTLARPLDSPDHSTRV